MAIVEFRIDMQSEAMRIFGRLENPPLKAMHTVMAKKTEILMKSRYFSRQETYGKEPSLYRGIKRALVGDIEPGFLSGSTYEGITGIVENLGYIYTAASVILQGKWPKAGTNKQGHIPISTIMALGGFEGYEEVDIDDELQISVESIAKRSKGIGAFVSLTTSGGFKVIWDEPLRDKFSDINVPSQPLNKKRYGELSDNITKEFLYFSKKDIEYLTDVASDLIDDLLGLGVSKDYVEVTYKRETAKGGQTKMPTLLPKEMPAGLPSQKSLLAEFTQALAEYEARLLQSKGSVLKYMNEIMEEARKEIIERLIRKYLG